MKVGKTGDENFRRLFLIEVSDMPLHKQILFDKKHHTPKVPNRKFTKTRRFIQGTIRRPYSDFNSVTKIAEIIFHKVGTGTFDLLFYGWGVNKHFRPNFTCKIKNGGSCVHYSKGKCHKYNTLQKGKGCKANPKICARYRKRGMITLKPREGLQLMGVSKPYKIIWHKTQDKMGCLHIGFKRDA